MYGFQSTIIVPDKVVRQIIDDYRKRIGAMMEQTVDPDIEDLIQAMDLVADAIANDERVSVGGYHLDDKHITGIARLLQNGEKINAIKEFRFATGAGLKDAKDFIDGFCINRRHAGPTAALQFRNAFGR